MGESEDGAQQFDETFADELHLGTIQMLEHERAEAIAGVAAAREAGASESELEALEQWVDMVTSAIKMEYEALLAGEDEEDEEEEEEDSDFEDNYAPCPIHA